MHQSCKMLIINNINALEKQKIKKGENTLFLSFSQRVFLDFYWGFTEKIKPDENFLLCF